MHLYAIKHTICLVFFLLEQVAILFYCCNRVTALLDDFEWALFFRSVISVIQSIGIIVQVANGLN